MTVDELRDQLTSSMPSLFGCDDLGDGQYRVRTPLLFPDGAVIDVFVSGNEGLYTVTDHGDAAGWLWTRAGDDAESSRQQTLIADICHVMGIEHDGERLVIRDVAPGNLADAIMRLAQAEARMAG